MGEFVLWDTYEADGMCMTCPCVFMGAVLNLQQALKGAVELRRVRSAANALSGGAPRPATTGAGPPVNAWLFIWRGYARVFGYLHSCRSRFSSVWLV